MYGYVDHMKCRGCGNTGLLFKMRVNGHEKKRTGNIVHVYTRECKLCYLERVRLKNEKCYGNVENRERINARRRAVRKGNPHYQEAARRSYWKNRARILERKKEKYVSVRQEPKRAGNTRIFSRKRRTKYGPLPEGHTYRTKERLFAATKNF